MKDFIVDVDLNNNNLVNVDSVTFNTSTTNTPDTAKIVWDDGEGVLKYGLKGGNVDLGVGQEEVVLVKNVTGSTIAKGKVVYINGASGNRPTVALADADTDATSSKTLGLTAESIADGAEGFVTTFGVLTNVNTSTFTAGQSLWLSSTAGELTGTVPTQPVHSVFVGYAISINDSSGRIFVNPQNGYELNELHNVLLEADGSIQDNEVLAWDSGSQLWKNQTPSEAKLIPETIIDAKGDLIVGTAADTASRLAVGATNGHVLTVDSAEATGVKWAAGGATDLNGLSDVDLNPAITVVATSSQNAGAATSMTFTLPSGMQRDDVCVIMVGSDGSTPAKPNGWSSLSASSDNAPGWRVLMKQMGATVDTTVSLTGLSISSTAVAIALRGASLETFVTTTGTGDPAQVVDPATVTTTIANSLVLVMAAVDDENVTTFTAPTGYSNFVYKESTTVGMTTMLATKVVSAAGSENPGSFGSTTVINDWFAISIVFQPKVAAYHDLIVYDSGSGQWVNISPYATNYSQTILTGFNAYFPVHDGAVTTRTVDAVGNMFLRPLLIDKTCIADFIGIEVTTVAASGTARLGIYNSGDDSFPSSLLLDAGTVSTTTTTGWREIAISQVLQPGLYWLAVVSQGTNWFTSRASQSGGLMPVGRNTGNQAANVTAYNGLLHSGSVTGALPSTYSFQIMADRVPRVMVRIS